jgi:hypothetical protein
LGGGARAPPGLVAVRFRDPAGRDGYGERALRGAAPETAAERYPEALVTLDRLRDGGLVRRRAGQGGPLYQLTRRGRAELRLQRLLWARVILARNAGQ